MNDHHHLFRWLDEGAESFIHIVKVKRLTIMSGSEKQVELIDTMDRAVGESFKEASMYFCPENGTNIVGHHTMNVRAALLGFAGAADMPTLFSEVIFNSRSERVQTVAKEFKSS